MKHLYTIITTFISFTIYTVTHSVSSVFSTILLPVDSEVKVTLTDTYQPVYTYINNKQYGFVIVQSHSQQKNVIASVSSSYIYGDEEKSKNAGIVKMFSKPVTSMTTYAATGNVDDTVNSVFFAISSIRDSPVPGGCCLTCALEIDPNIKLTYDFYKTHLIFHRASRYWNYDQEIPDCDSSDNPSTYNLKYGVYYYYVDENDYELETLFDSLWKMSSPDQIKKHGSLLTEMTSSDSLSFDTETVFGQGVIFNVIVTDTFGGNVYETAYVPVSTYACDFTAPKNSSENCHSKGSIVSMVFCICFAIVGLVLCFAGFKLFRGMVFLSGLLIWWFIIYVLLAKYGDPKVHPIDTFAMSFMVSICGGGFILFLYAFDKWFYVCYLHVTVVFGMFFSAIIFYTPFGYLEFWDVDYRFGLGFASGALMVIIFFLFFPKELCYLSSSLLGSYAVIMVPNYFLRANMQYIVLTVIYRLTIPNFGTSYLRRPFVKLEYILTAVWGFLFVLGVLVQYRTTKNEQFRFSGSKVRHKIWDKFSQSVRIRKGIRKRKPTPARLYYERPDDQQNLLVSNNLLQDNFSYGATNEEINNFAPYQPIDSPTDVSSDSQECQPLIHHECVTTHQALLERQAPYAPSPPPPYQLPHHDFGNHEIHESECQPLLQTPNASSRPTTSERYPKIFVV